VKWLQYLFTFLLAILGYFLGNVLENNGLLGNPINIVYLTLSGLLLGVLFGVLALPRITIHLGKLGRKFLKWWRHVPPEKPLAVVAATTLALFFSVLITTLLGQAPWFGWYFSLAISLLIMTVLNFLALSRSGLFRSLLPPAVRSSEALRGAKVLDTSVLIDGRIANVATEGFLEGPLVVPGFVLRELQTLSDSGDPQKRLRGRRGLEVVAALKQVGQLITTPSDGLDIGNVDHRLLEFCRSAGCTLITNDSALLQLARLEEIRAISIQSLAAALRSQHTPGEVFEVEIVRGGKEPGQGVGYLDDGSMVVVDGAYGHQGKTVEVVVTQAIQTHVGRMFFARLERS